MRPCAGNKPLAIESLHQIGGEGLTDPLDANSYVLMGRHPILFDCGTERGYPQLLQNLGDIGIKAADIDKVFISHGHDDHYRAMVLLAQESDARMYAPKEDAEAVEKGDTIATVAYYYGHEALPMKVDGVIDGDFCLETDTAKITIIQTPWHTPGSVCYKIEQDRSTTLITADTLYGFYFPSENRSILADMQQGKESMRRLRSGTYDYMAMGHAVLGFMDDVAVRLEEAERQFASPGVLSLLEEYGENLPVCINPWQKPTGQSFRY